MARHLRVEFPGAIYHVTCRMIGDSRLDQSRLFTDDKERERFLERLSDRVEQYNIRLYLFVLMTNHFHLKSGVLHNSDDTVRSGCNFEYTYDSIGNMTAGGALDSAGNVVNSFTADNFNFLVNRDWSRTVNVMRNIGVSP